MLVLIVPIMSMSVLLLIRLIFTLIPTPYQEHILLVILPVARRLPQILLINQGSHNLLVTVSAVFAPQKVLEAVNNTGAVGEHEDGARTEGMNHEERLSTADVTVIAGVILEYLLTYSLKNDRLVSISHQRFAAVV
ncbi:hypothetical protein BC936DRAFT_142550 [Jimgerdemannia flammicorona]|uniref:Uncharacterized protein n=2 Tax=Jimgerdemannia flammicorona TaxID=994334 RepID=A0A433DF04_9FUNG|nr:hypothetical protein BC936DRAFT_142550 [Jimgerdemannia flammicorona]RUS26014.1 hypothetical protein BC938DRAFT_471345 [Jimgerdemannia flammicorona]